MVEKIIKFIDCGRVDPGLIIVHINSSGMLDLLAYGRQARIMDSAEGSECI